MSGHGTAPMRWLAFPGFACLPSDFDELRRRARSSGHTVRALNQWRVPLDSGPDAILTAAGRPEGQIGLIGHSLGALTALELALARPELVTAIVVLNPVVATAGGHVPQWLEWPGADHLVQRAAEVFGSRRWLRPLPALLYREVFRAAGVALTGAERRRGGRLLTDEESMLALWRQLRDRQEFVARVDAAIADGWQSGRVPTVHLVGMRGVSAKFLRGQREYAARLDATLVGLRHCGHFVARERPDAVLAAMDAARDAATTDVIR